MSESTNEVRPNEEPRSGGHEANGLPEHEGPIEKIKKAVGHAIGSEGPRHGARDTDPGS
ncbi:MAG: hypothetical protein ACTHMS_23715 [Jatrophihabitans sp.]|uniref:hypothetical protein n=1 Tax=Jatrophihabitans sp. TaxID=1932789 RepID=UPI003F808AEC